MIAKELQVDVEDIYGSDLYLYNRMQPTIWELMMNLFHHRDWMIYSVPIHLYKVS